ncbi:hypothetical protein PTKIN_Ptkin15bG0168500 [Pterospermum kingtungense]
MAIEISKDLITQLKISLRSQANVPNYDPNDSSLPTLPSLTHSVSDSAHHRCLHCSAHLLRGPNSLVCIFCGKHQTNSEEPPQPIKFKATTGYRWFLHSLNLDGSEIVGESLEGKESNRGSREGVLVSDLLDLEIRWNDADSDKFGSGLRKNNALNLAGFDVDDDFLAERKADSVSIPSLGTLAVKKENDSAGSSAFESRENLSLFENFQGSKSSGSVSGWQADFQFADSKTDQNAISSQSFDPIVGSSKDLSSHTNTVIGHGQHLSDETEKGNQTSSESKTNNWFQQSDSASGVTIEKDDISSSMNLDWIQGDKAQISASNASGKDSADLDDDSLDARNDFKASTNAQDGAQSASDLTTDGLKSMHEKGSSADLSTHTDSVFGTGKAVDNPTSSHTTNWFQDDLWNNSTSGMVHHADKSDADVGDKDVGLFGNINNSSVSINRIQDDQRPISGNKCSADSATNDEDDDSFGTWSDFRSSSILNSSISSWKEPSTHTSSTKEKSSDLFSGWDTDFQSTNSKNNHEGSKSSDPFVSSLVDLSGHMDTVFASGKDIVDGKSKDGSNANSWFEDDLWSNSTSKLTQQAENFDATIDVKDFGTGQTVQNSPSMDVDWFPDDQWLTGNNKAPDKKTVDESDDSFGDWSDFKISTNTLDGLSNSWKQAAIPDNQTIDENDDWNDFTSSTCAKDPSSVSFKQTVHHEKPSIETSEIDLFSVDNSLRHNNFGSFSQSDFFSGAVSNKNGSSEINIMQPEAPIPDRVADANVIGGNNSEIAEDGDFSTATAASKTDDIETLMSQMHDLSFMLDSNLSVPPKLDA